MASGTCARMVVSLHGDVKMVLLKSRGIAPRSSLPENRRQRIRLLL